MKFQYSLQINTPCHEAWENMQPNELGRYCLACQKTVIDFSQMTDIEIATFLHLHQGESFCANIEVAQSEKKYTFIQTQVLESPVKRYVVALLAGLTVIPITASGQDDSSQRVIPQFPQLDKIMSIDTIPLSIDIPDGYGKGEEIQIKEERGFSGKVIEHSPNLISGQLINSKNGLPVKFAKVQTYVWELQIVNSEALMGEYYELKTEINRIETTYKKAEEYLKEPQQKLQELEAKIADFEAIKDTLTKKGYEEFGAYTDENGYFQFFLPAEIAEADVIVSITLQDNKVKDNTGKPVANGNIKKTNNLLFHFKGGTYYKEVKITIENGYDLRYSRGFVVAPRPIIIE